MGRQNPQLRRGARRSAEGKPISEPVHNRDRASARRTGVDSRGCAMSALLELQRRVAAAVMQPLTRDEGMRRKTADGRSMQTEAEAIIKPNARLSSFDRLEIYNRQYWFR